MNAIIFPRIGGGVRVVYPASSKPIEELAKTVVPAGRPFLIVDAALIPEDRTYREAWDADFTNPDGHGEGADDGI